MSKKLKTTDIKGKPYVEVNERLRYFRENHKGYSLTSVFAELTPEYCVIRATICDENGTAVATGTAREVNGDSFINKTSYVENCETSAWGRALGCFGIGISGSVASAEEVGNAVLNQKAAKKTDKKDTEKPDTNPEPKINEIVEQAFWEFETLHKDALASGFHYSKTIFYNAVEQKVGHLPDCSDEKLDRPKCIAYILKQITAHTILEQDKE